MFPETCDALLFEDEVKSKDSCVQRLHENTMEP